MWWAVDSPIRDVFQYLDTRSGGTLFTFQDLCSENSSVVSFVGRTQTFKVLFLFKFQPISMVWMTSLILNTHHVVFHYEYTAIDIKITVVAEHGGRHIDEIVWIRDEGGSRFKMLNSTKILSIFLPEVVGFAISVSFAQPISWAPENKATEGLSRWEREASQFIFMVENEDVRLPKAD